MGMIRQHAEHQRHADDQREELLSFRMQHQVNRTADGDAEQQEVDEILSFISDRPLGQDFLQLSRRHQTAGKSQPSENHFHGEHRHSELRTVLGSQIKLRRAHQSDAECAESVAERGPLRDGGHLHHAERDADAASEHEPDGNPFIVDDAVVQQSAGDGQHHADFARQDPVAGGGGRTHPLQRQDKQGAGNQIDRFDDVLASGELVHG